MNGVAPSSHLPATRRARAASPALLPPLLHRLGAPALGTPAWGRGPAGIRMTAAEPHTPSSLAALIHAIARRQDRDAFAALFAHFAPRVKSYLLRLGAGAGQAEELAQETLLTVWRKAPMFDPDRAGAATWIFTIARNLRIDARRRERDPQAVADALATDPDHQADSPPTADAALAAAEQEARLGVALATLPPEQADVIRLSFFQDKPHAQIERELGIPLGTVKSRLRLAMQRLRAAMEQAL